MKLLNIIIFINLIMLSNALEQINNTDYGVHNASYDLKTIIGIISLNIIVYNIY